MDTESREARTSVRPHNKAVQWLVEQLGLRSLDYEIPDHAQRIYSFFGGITLGGMVVLFLTGFYLLLFYSPVPAEARDSVVNIITGVGFGEFVRSVHSWAAKLVLIAVTLHLARVFVTASYKRERQINWVLGVVLFLLTLSLYFSGTVLKWDQEGYEALGHMSEVGKLVGGWIGSFVNGGPLGVPLLTKFAFVHVAILPTILAVLIGVHLLLIKLQGISPLPLRGQRDGSSAYDNYRARTRSSRFYLHLQQLIGYSMLLAALVALLALVVPATLGMPVTPGIEVTKPVFFFWSFVALENWWGIKALLWATVVIPVVMIAVPFIDRTPFRHIMDRKWMFVLGIVAVLVVATLTILGGLVPTGVHIK